jgi:tetratricopeptide (TPR) repeat protein
VRAETRHQLKQDRFSQATLHAAEQTVHWTVEHQSKLIIAGIVVAAAALIAFGGWYYMNVQDEKASLELGAATRVLDEPVRPAGVPAQPGFPSFASAQERATEAHKKFQAIVDQYPHTRTAEMARYFVGLTSSQMGDNAGAERSLQQVANSSNKDMAALAKFALASVLRAENKDAQAVDLYKQLIDKPTTTVNKVTAQMELAQFYEGRQKLDEAKRIYDQIQKENPATEAAQSAQQRATKLK